VRFECLRFFVWVGCIFRLIWYFGVLELMILLGFEKMRALGFIILFLS